MNTYITQQDKLYINAIHIDKLIKLWCREVHPFPFCLFTEVLFRLPCTSCFWPLHVVLHYSPLAGSFCHVAFNSSTWCCNTFSQTEGTCSPIQLQFFEWHSKKQLVLFSVLEHRKIGCQPDSMPGKHWWPMHYPSNGNCKYGGRHVLAFGRGDATASGCWNSMPVEQGVRDHGSEYNAV